MRLLPLVFALTLAPSLALADDSPAPAPITPWIVTGAESGTVKIAQLGETSLGTIAGWKCRATLSTSTESSKRVDALMVSCVKGDTMVRSQAKHAEGTAAGEGGMLQISAADGSKVARTILFGPV